MNISIKYKNYYIMLDTDRKLIYKDTEQDGELVSHTEFIKQTFSCGVNPSFSKIIKQINRELK